jgi:hypothetical protein
MKKKLQYVIEIEIIGYIYSLYCYFFYKYLEGYRHLAVSETLANMKIKIMPFIRSVGSYLLDTLQVND